MFIEDYTNEPAPVKKEKKGDHFIVIHYDDDVENPRKWMDTFGTMLCFHRRRTLGDENVWNVDPDDFGGWDDLEGYIRHSDDTTVPYNEDFEEGLGAVLVLPLSLYDHSGVSMSVGVASGWDCGQVGFIYCTQKDLDDHGVTLEVAEKNMRAEVALYDQYLQGDVYRVTVEDTDGVALDTVSGVYGRDYANDYGEELLKEALKAS